MKSISFIFSLQITKKYPYALGLAAYFEASVGLRKIWE